MIVRILGEGQLHVDDDAAGELNQLDAALEAAVDGDDEPGYARALAALLERVRAVGTAAEPDSLEPSVLIIPPADATMAEVRKMLAGEGLIPG